MSLPVQARAALVLWLLLLGAGCAAGRRSVSTVPPGEAIGVYRARIQLEDGRARRFKLLLFAAAPDRLHAEVVSPVGGTELVIDGGAGRVAVALPRESVAWAGADTPEAFEAVLGLRLRLRELVAAVLSGTSPGAGIEVSREPPGAPGLPGSLDLRSAGNTLRLELRRLVSRPPGLPPLGTGAPPAGLEVRPLAELPSLLPGADP